MSMCQEGGFLPEKASYLVCGHEGPELCLPPGNMPPPWAQQAEATVRLVANHPGPARIWAWDCRRYAYSLLFAGDLSKGS